MSGDTPGKRSFESGVLAPNRTAAASPYRAPTCDCRCEFTRAASIHLRIPFRSSPSPRLASDIHVLLTIDPSNYPLGIKGLMTEKDGDVPVMWTNTNYKMVYMNMGHGDKVFTSPLQNQVIENAVLWLLGKPTKLIHE